MKSISVLASILAMASCGKSNGDAPAAGKVASCAMMSEHQCREYNERNLALGAEMLQKLCMAPAVFALSACPTTDVIGTCTTREAKDIFYKGATDADLEKQCAARIPAGTWERR